MNVLESVRMGFKPQALVMITSDKAYRNNEWEWGYRESDELGGDDPYSASKGCAELIIRSYIASFFSEKILFELFLTNPRASSTIAESTLDSEIFKTIKKIDFMRKCKRMLLFFVCCFLSFSSLFKKV